MIVHSTPGVEHTKQVDVKTKPLVRALFDLLLEDFHETDRLEITSKMNEKNQYTSPYSLQRDMRRKRSR